ncbi:hypothetical protein Nepgr_003877 [Nepenthes gracilis]|uniref:Uncharacterized protein n=1 Tax=Nepenthes gracilis TaxID=150966 RepID=A0AAD3XEB6_NEPGR|nr:hypothetical protein Nepgr_003877 [Nepenthes gracilis]
MERLNYARVCVEIARGAQLPSIVRLKSDVDIEIPSVDIVVSYHGKPVQPVKSRSAILGSKSAVVNSVSPILNDVSWLNSSAEDLRVPVGVAQVTTSLLPSSPPSVGVGQELGVVDQELQVVRFAPEILSTEALSYASRCRKMAPCSDIRHPLVSRISILGPKDSLVAPLEAIPVLASSPLPPEDAP